MPQRKKGLTKQQQAFVREYVGGKNVRQAAWAAGAKHPDVAGYRLMKNAKVAAAIREAEEEASGLAAQAAKALEILLYLMENAESDSVRLRAAQEVLDRARRNPAAGREEPAGAEQGRTLIDYDDPQAVAARIEELRKRLGEEAVKDT